MEISGANPFLFSADEHQSPPSGSNPFLMEDFEVPVENVENPFFSFQQQEETNQSPATNPFMFEPSEAEQDYQSNILENAQQQNNIFDLDSSGNGFSKDSSNLYQQSYAITSNRKLSTDNENLSEMISNRRLSTDSNKSDKMPPKRPPPPRPGPPPAIPFTHQSKASKETKDLVLSVTGTMDANSSHLLDKIPPTRTPSPVSIRDLHSPSPTPEATFGDLVDITLDDKDTSNVNLFDINNDFISSDNKVLSEPAKIVQSNLDIFGSMENISTNINEPSKKDSEVLKCNKISELNSLKDIEQPSIQQVISEPVVNKPPPPVPRPPPPKPPSQKIPPNKPPPPPSVDVSKEIKFNKNIENQQINSTNDILSNVYETKKQINDSDDLIFTPNKNLIDDKENIDAQNNSLVNPFSLEEKTQNNIVQLNESTSIKETALLSDFNSNDSFGKNEKNILDNNFSTYNANLEENKQDKDELIDKKEDTFNRAFDSVPKKTILQTFQKQSEDFDAFAAKFESAGSNDNKSAFDAFGQGDTWGSETTADEGFGFGADEPFDTFAPSIQASNIKRDSESDEEKDFSVFIKPKELNLSSNNNLNANDSFVPTLAPPPKSPQLSSYSDSSSRVNPFDQDAFGPVAPSGNEFEATFQDEPFKSERKDSQESAQTPLYDEDTSVPLEEFPRSIYHGEGWEMQLRQPNKKKITGQRFWKKIFIRLIYQGDNPVIQLFNEKTSKDPFQELPLQACYSVSEIGAQQYDQFGKIFTVKLQYIFYKERPGVRPGQVTKAERITNKLSQFAAYAIQGDYQGVKEFGSDLKKLGLPVEHAPQVSQLFKIGSHNYEHMKEFSCTVEEALFRLTVHRDRALTYKMEEVQITAVDELYVEQNAEGGIDRQIARVRVFFLAFLSGMPDIELGVNDMRRQGKEVVGRHDILPVATEEWIRLENVEFHACVQQEEYHKTHIIKFKPPDACYIELLRFRIRPPKNRELPLQLKATMCVTGNKVELRADVLVPGFASRKLGQIPCEDVAIRFPIPECWIYLFRVEKHFRYGSVKSTHRRTGKVKGIERLLGTVETLQESLIEVTSGQAKYEHQHRAIVWRCPRLPKEGQGAYTTHNLVCRMALTSFDQIPEQLAEYAYIEFTMPATQASHTTIRSVSVQESDSDEPPEKFVRYLARHEYRVGIEHTKGEGPAAYISATMTTPKPAETTPTPAPIAESSESDSD